jgi:hypothetical protein
MMLIKQGILKQNLRILCFLLKTHAGYRKLILLVDNLRIQI